MRAAPEELSFSLETGNGQSADICFLVSQLPPVSALKLASKLGRILGPAISDLASSASGGLNATVDLSKLGVGLQKMCSNLDDSQIDDLVSGLLEAVQTLKDGKTSKVSKNLFNDLFTGHLRESFQLLVLVVRVNFADFFPNPAASAK